MVIEVFLCKQIGNILQKLQVTVAFSFPKIYIVFEKLWMHLKLSKDVNY